MLIIQQSEVETAKLTKNFVLCFVNSFRRCLRQIWVNGPSRKQLPIFRELIVRHAHWETVPNRIRSFRTLGQVFRALVIFMGECRQSCHLPSCVATCSAGWRHDILHLRCGAAERGYAGQRLDNHGDQQCSQHGADASTNGVVRRAVWAACPRLRCSGKYLDQTVCTTNMLPCVENMEGRSSYCAEKSYLPGVADFFAGGYLLAHQERRSATSSRCSIGKVNCFQVWQACPSKSEGLRVVSPGLVVGGV